LYFKTKNKHVKIQTRSKQREHSYVIQSITTDMGTEFGMIKLPYIVDVFFLWLHGRPIHQLLGKVDLTSRFLPRAIGNPGWSHIFSGLMYRFCKRHPRWPEILVSLRALCRWFRNETHRDHLKVKLKFLNLGNLLDSFDGHFAKWRYQTLFLVLTSLLRLRHVCQGYIKRDMFPNPQDSELLDQVLYACNWKFLWSWSWCAAHYGIRRLEKMRRWGLVCDCCAASYADGKRPNCDRSSRRLKNARKFIDQERAHFREQEQHLSLNRCEDSEELMRWTSYSLRCLTSDLGEKFKFLDDVPCRFSEAEDPEEAAECVRQVMSKPLDAHDPCTVDIWQRLEGDLRARSLGGDMSSALTLELTARNNIPLDEGPGEGYHRHTNLTRQRSGHVRLHWILASVRHKQVIGKCKKFMKDFGKAGRNVINYEYRQYKRLLQTNSKKRTMGVQMRPRDFFKRMYRMDDKARDDFGVLIDSTVSKKTSPSTTTTRLQIEYLQVVLKPETHFSVTLERDTDGGGVVEEAMFFLVMGVRGPSQKPKLVATHSTVTLGPVTVQIQHLDTWNWNKSLDAPTIQVFPEMDPDWINILDVAPFARMQFSLDEYSHGISDARGCMQLSQRRRAVPMMPLTDVTCPCMSIINGLVSVGWIPIDGKVVHDATQRNFDGRNLASNKLYLQCCLQIDDVMRQNETMVSQQPQSYYKLMLRGGKVDANLGDKDYKELLGQEQLAIANDEPDDVDVCEAPLAIANAVADDDVDVCGIVMPAIADGLASDPTVPRAARGVAPPRAAAKPFALRPGGPAPDVVDKAGSSSPSSSSSSGTASSDSEVDVAGVDAWTMLADGIKVRRDAYTPKNKAPYERWIMKCTHHKKCVKKRTFAATKRFGRIEPLAYCFAWHNLGALPGLDAKTHMHRKPTEGAVADWVAEHGKDFESSFFK
jgi:hypothetical protein